MEYLGLNYFVVEDCLEKWELVVLSEGGVFCLKLMILSFLSWVGVCGGWCRCFFFVVGGRGFVVGLFYGFIGVRFLLVGWIWLGIVVVMVC